MSAARLLIHLGLPKTATTSIQHNVFASLHDNGKINFLGKFLDYDYKTGMVTTKNYRGKFIRDVAEGKMAIAEGRSMLEKNLDQSRLNVFSDEGIMIAYPGRDNLSLFEKFKNLEALFSGYTVEVVVTLRDPVDYLYSLYVQLYPDFFSKNRALNSIDKFAGLLLEFPGDVLFESFHYKKWLPKLDALFPVTIVEYEQIKNPASLFHLNWSRLLGMSDADFFDALNKEKVNAKRKTGKEVGVVRDFKGIELYFYNLLASKGVVFSAVRAVYKLSGIKKILHYRFGSWSTHKYPSGELNMKLKKALEFGGYRYDEYS